MLKENDLESPNAHASSDVDEKVDPSLVRQEVGRIVASRHFQTSRRCKEFLLYVVSQKISGNGDQLKERVIGVQIFGRKPDYATGEDPVVRVKAGDVRRRLELYYAENEAHWDILIQIPLGSYSPVFRLRREDEAHRKRDLAWSAHTGTEGGRGSTLHAEEIENPDHESPGFSPESAAGIQVAASESRVPRGREGDRTESGAPRWGVGRSTLLACLLISASLIAAYLYKRPANLQKDFWLPASLSSKPVLLWLPKPILYRPANTLFERYGKSHPNTFVTREERSDRILPLDPSDSVRWGDMWPDHNSGPGIGGVTAAMNINKLLTERGIPFELRFGEEASYAEMRSSPVVIIGAINADWAPQLTSELKFVFDETPGAPAIRELGGSKRVWKTETGNEGRITRDYGLITRQLSGKAGQFLVQVAGISHFGTEAASEMLLQQQDLTRVLHSESIDLRTKNLQIVVSTDLTDRRTGPPHVVAVASW